MIKFYALIAAGVQRRRYIFCPCFLPPTKEEVHVFACVCLFVCLLARLLKIACMDMDEMLHVDTCRDMDEMINF